MRKFLRNTMLLALMGIGITACKGPQGEIGPEGPQGPQGEQGIQGEEGTAGAYQFSTGAAETDGEGFLGFTLELTQETLPSIEKGVILVYAKSQNFWFPLPGIVIFANNQVSDYSFFYGIENLDLSVILLQNSSTAVKRNFQDIRIVVVPAINARMSEKLDLKSYEEVQKAFNLPK
ncbi:hypothetical protein [Telluribacter sp.]|jgi:hypothetical protein|uniref:hypothetical protein n=1 Tax=Telluribacter sp. TaxID=1978767 RepID=UPI002E10357C|nr:hypothetical protein [Telluribacter sp.]